MKGVNFGGIYKEILAGIFLRSAVYGLCLAVEKHKKAEKGK